MSSRKQTLHKGIQVPLHTWIYDHQDVDLERVAAVTGKSKADVIREAFTIYLNTMRSEGVIKDDEARDEGR